MTSAGDFTYDQVPYPNLAHYNTHPDGMAAVATLAGMSPAPVDRCRVLELGCGSGWNLIPMADTLPYSQFTGIDLSLCHIQEGQRAVSELCLENLRLRQMDLLDFSHEMGQFDYIIVHGVYSWVPEPVREKILDICKHNLAEQGIAYVSYNTYPGWHLINIVRDLMRYQSRAAQDPRERAQQARESLAFFAQLLPPERSLYVDFIQHYHRFLEGEVEGVFSKDDSALLHDELSETNQPFYFYQFVEQAEAHGLQYLADGYLGGIAGIPPQSLEALRQNSRSLVELEQAFDFLQNRTFRQTLLCHQEVGISRRVPPEVVQKFYLSTQARPASDTLTLDLVSTEEFVCEDGAKLTIDHPLSKAAMLSLAEASPQALSFAELLEAARGKLQPRPNRPANPEQDLKVLGYNLLRAFSYSRGLVELHTLPRPFTKRIDRCPEASRVIRYQAGREQVVTNLRHERIRTEEMDRFLLVRLDGSRGIGELVEDVLEAPEAPSWLKTEGMELAPAGEPRREQFRRVIEQKLLWFAESAMFFELKKSGDGAYGAGKSN